MWCRVLLPPVGNRVMVGHAIQAVCRLYAALLLRLVLLLVLPALSSCAATVAKPHLYLLTSEPTTQSTVAEQCAPVAVAVQLPAYLERDGLVLQLNDNELVAADNHLWAEPLVYGVERLLNVCLNPVAQSNRAENSQGQDATNGVQQIKVVVEQLHGDAQGSSRLQATWSKTIAGSSGPARLHRFSASAQQAMPGYDALVSVQRGLLLDLCTQMTQQLALCSR